jgi:hypothetical protein
MTQNFEITLLLNIKTKTLVTTYSACMVPSIGDKIILDENKLFVVQERLLGNNDSNKIILLGEMI